MSPQPYNFSAGNRQFEVRVVNANGEITARVFENGSYTGASCSAPVEMATDFERVGNGSMDDLLVEAVVTTIRSLLDS